MAKQNIKASINIEEGNQKKLLELDVIQSSMGSYGLDISDLYRKTGFFTFDPGYGNTANCCSSITYVDGTKGQLAYRGISIEELADKCSIEEVAFLILYGDMPATNELKQFQSQLVGRMKDNFTTIKGILDNISTTLHPMSIIMATMSQLSTSHCQLSVDPKEKDAVKKIEEAAILAISQVVMLVAMVYQKLQNRPFLQPNVEYDLITNFTHLLLSKTDEDIKSVNIAAKSALEKLFILHADHEQNASTATVRSIASTGSNLCASLIAGIAALWGPLHGGASEAVIHMLNNISSIDNVDHYLDDVRSGKVRLMGFGHRIYKNYDPRAKIIKEYSKKCTANGILQDTHLLDIATKIEDTALKDPYFIEHKLFPNVDFYSGVIYHSLGLPPTMFIPLFAAARVIGWASQWREFILSPKEQTRITRPRQIYMGAVPSHDYVFGNLSRHY